MVRGFFFFCAWCRQVVSMAPNNNNEGIFCCGYKCGRYVVFFFLLFSESLMYEMKKCICNFKVHEIYLT